LRSGRSFDRQEDAWLVIVIATTMTRAGILAHLLYRLRSSDLWEAVRHRFAASGIDPALTQVKDSRELATGRCRRWLAGAAGIRPAAMPASWRPHLDLDATGSTH
jgi:hypothetical protein